MKPSIVLIAALLAAAPAPSRAQDGERDAVRTVVDRLFQGMAEADSAMARSAFADGARFASVAVQEEAATFQYQNVDGWLGAVAGSERRWEERIHDVEVRVDDDVASVWAPYTFLLDGEVHHCGVDSMELLRTPEGWKITQLSDTRRTEGCAAGEP
ncbi:MAG TPA: nuclear transport factor 2 family protein [Longimicrobiales bacterium]|nr:nuclear transport factor 2 family protein [Longimicrobiales bacterium]